MLSRRQLYNALENPHTRSFLWVNDILAVLTLLSVASIILETVESLSAYASVFAAIEYATVAAFTAEYAARLYTTRRPLSYVFSFFGVIDLLAVVPTYLGLGNLTYLKSARVLRIMRFLRIIRIAKVSRTSIWSHASPTTLNIAIYCVALFSAILLFGSVIYVIEHGNVSFANVPLGMLWAAKTLLGGLGGSTESQIPLSEWGQGIALAARFTGLLLIGLLVSVMGNIMRIVLTGRKRA